MTDSNREKFKRQQAFEHEQRPLVDSWYKSLGYKVDRSVEGRHWDCALSSEAEVIKVEEKFRRRGKGERQWRDLLIEMVQDIYTGSPGWFVTCRADKVYYYMTDHYGIPEVCHIIDWVGFRRDFSKVSKDIERGVVTSDKGAGTPYNLILPIYAIEFRPWYERKEVQVDLSKIYRIHEVDWKDGDKVVPLRVVYSAPGYRAKVKEKVSADFFITEEEEADFFLHPLHPGILQDWLDGKMKHERRGLD